MDKEQLLQYLKDNLIKYDNLIAVAEDLKKNLELAIEQQKQFISDLEKQQNQADVDIKEYNTCKSLVDQIIVIVEKS
jgi:AAA15 family ATPase/GTPase